MNLREYLHLSQKRLTEAGIDNPQLDARLLIAHALGCDRAALISQSERELTPTEISSINALIERRTKREPVARILGLREFWGLPFGLNEETLEPRPDSETLIETALKRVTVPPRRILDLGTGTGCLLLALLSEWPDATGVGIDISPRTLEQAQENAARLALDTRAKFQKGNWLEDVTEKFDVIVSNPPYIKSSDISTLQPEVKNFDPLAALDGGADGLAPYKTLIPLLPLYLNKASLVFFETGYDQAKEVSHLLREAGFADITATKDHGGNDRVVSGLYFI